MSEVIETGSFAVPADRLWALVSDFGGLAEIMEGIDECRVEGQGVGATRHIPGKGGTVVESLDVLDPQTRTLVYSIVEGPMPFANYSASMVVTEAGSEASVLTWTGTFDAAGIPTEKAESLASRIYQGGIAGYTKALGL